MRRDQFIILVSAVWLILSVSACSDGGSKSSGEESSRRTDKEKMVAGSSGGKKAIGDLSDLPVQKRRFFTPVDDFLPVPEPGPNDWLAVHNEPGQTFRQYRASNPLRPSGGRNVMYVQPLGSFSEGQSPPLGVLKKFARRFYQMKVRVLDSINPDRQNLTTRRNPRSGKKQILTSDVLRMLRRRIPEDAYCVLAITMVDLYPEPSWNFVFGEASLRRRVGVFSFARYDPAFYGRRRREDYKNILLKRSCKVLAHETGHMFGMEHCIYFSCLMNGSNNLRESDSRPLLLCPVCLRKLSYNAKLNLQKRYRELKEFYRRHGFEEADWIQNRLRYVKDEE